MIVGLIESRAGGMPAPCTISANQATKPYPSLARFERWEMLRFFDPRELDLNQGFLCFVNEAGKFGVTIALWIGAMDSDAVEADENFLIFEIADDALERAAAVSEVQVTTIGICTHWYHCSWPL